MKFLHVKNQVQQLIDFASSKQSTTNIIMIATVKDVTNKWLDYGLHSVSTSYLSRQSLEELISSFRNYSTYLEVYTDVEEFLADYYANNLRVQPTLIFETSAKGIGRGKDALIPALCDILHLPHLGSSATSCVICSSKYQWTSILRQHGIPVPDSYLFVNGNWLSPPPLGIKHILKLNYECASIGLSAESVMINDGTNLTDQASQLQKNYQQPIIAQTFIEGYEVEVPILSNRKFRAILPPIGLTANGKQYYKQEFFDYDTIYFDNYHLYDFNDVQPKTVDQIRVCAQKVVDVLDLDGYIRIDFRIGVDGSFCIFDINNDPCITSCGSFYKSIELLGFDPKVISGVLIGNRMI